MSRLLISIVLLFSAAMLQASPLDDARNAGQIVELPSGYVQATGSAPAQIKALAADVNKRRKAAYEQIAKKNGISVEQVAIESYKKRSGG
jgi:uncharacterized protein YdbL (DUF1318 family)